MFLIHTELGWLRHFDGSDFLWTSDRSKAWKMNRQEVYLATNRLWGVASDLDVFDYK